MNDKIFLPGEEIIESDSSLKINPVVYYVDEKNRKRFQRLSLLRDNSIIPLKGPYIPRIGDQIIGVISDVKFAYYDVELNVAFSGILPARETKFDFRVGQIISAIVEEIDENLEITLGKPRALRRGTIISIDPTKIPRILGKEDTMLNLIKNKLNCEIIVGKNGYIWLNGENIPHAIEILKLIESQAHVRGLTNKIENMLAEINQELKKN
ncbi:MAG: KH domain-containing protein [Candidatus Anstonellales archaeon]